MQLINWHLVELPSYGLLPVHSPGTKQSHFSVQEHICSSQPQSGSSSRYWWHLMKQRPIFEWSTWDNNIKSMFLIDLIGLSNHFLASPWWKVAQKTQACMTHTVWILFLWAGTVSGPYHSRHDEGEVIVVPIWPHNELRARRGVTNRNMS